MRTQIPVPERFELYISDLDNHILIENSTSGVVISAARDNFSDQRKTFFIRQLAAEGYIPDRYKWFSDPAADGFFGVRWITGPPADQTKTRFFSIRNHCTRRNVLYGCLFVVWLLFFIWAVHHTRATHGLGL